MNIFVFKGGKPIQRSAPDRENPCWIDCDSLNETIISFLKENKVDTKTLTAEIGDVKGKIVNKIGKVAFFSLRFINEKKALDKIWLFFLKGCVITNVRRSNDWDAVYERLKHEAETKNLDENQIFANILAEIVASNGTKVERIWKEEDKESIKKLLVILNEEEEILKAVLSGKLIPLRYEQHDLLMETFETVKMQKSLFSS